MFFLGLVCLSTAPDSLEVTSGSALTLTAFGIVDMAGVFPTSLGLVPDGCSDGSVCGCSWCLLYVDLILSMGPLLLFVKLFTDNSFGPHLASHYVALYSNGVAFLQRRQTLSTMAIVLCLLVLMLLDQCTDFS